MSLASNIREQLLKSFRAELAEHIQTMTDGMLALEQGRSDQNTLDTAFRAAHSLKGASRAMGVTAIEQIAHALESILDGLRRGTLTQSPELYTACYTALDTIQLVQASYEAGETTPPVQALMALGDLEKMRLGSQKATPAAAEPAPQETVQPVETTADQPAVEQKASPAATVQVQQPVQQPPVSPTAVSQPPVAQPPAAQAKTADVAPARSTAKSSPAEAQPVSAPEKDSVAQDNGITNGTVSAANTGPMSGLPSIGDETIRVDVHKLDTLMANLSELLIARIRLEQRQTQIRQIQNMLAEMQRLWSPARGPFNRLQREQEDGLLSLHRPRSVDSFSGGPSNGANGSKQRNEPALRASSNVQNGLLNSGADLKELVELGKDAAHLLRFVSTNQEQMRALHNLVNEMARQYTSDTMHLSMVIDGLESEIKRLRMLPFTTITTTFARMIRDLATQSGKDVTVTILGGDTEVDKRILEGIKDPITHLLRNAVDHGIEKPEVRLSKGKPRTGQITLSAEQIGKEVIVRISDDGSGLDIEGIRQAVARQNMHRSGISNAVNTEEEIKVTGAHSLSSAELIDAIFNLGISTSRIITDVSGRGVGLNVVRNNIETLRGRVDVESKRGEGTTFILTLPLALTGSRSLMIKSAGQLFALPINNVERSLHVQPSEIFSLEGFDTILYNNRPVPLVRLSDVLDLSEAQDTYQGEKKRLSAVVLTVDERRPTRAMARQVAFLVDELVGEQEVVIKGLGKQLSRVAGIAGATVMGSGEVVLILNASDLMKLAARPGSRSVLESLKAQPAPEENRAHKRILVVDDSITTRTLEKNILEAAGYTVLLATDGYEALGVVRSPDRPDLVVTDIVMPRMDGFELTHQIKKDTQTSDLPVILVTSLDSQEDKERGIEVQADAYIVKSSFDQVNLLETIEQLI